MTRAVAWDRAAEGWNRNTPLIRAWLREATAAMLDEARIGPGAKVLDIAAGAGDQTEDFARAVGPTGSVLATDVSPTILGFARANLQAAGLTNVRFAVADAEQPLPIDEPVDAAICRLGLMLCMNPDAALAAAFKALRPGGRYVALVFGDPAHTPCVSILMKVALKHRGLPASATPYAPGGLFSLAEAGKMESLLAAAGYEEIHVAALSAPFDLPDAAAYIAFVRSAGSPVMEVLAPLDEAARHAAWQEMETELGQFQDATGWHGPNQLLLCSATRPR
ncbi:hypothetical protein BH09PSE5_BH09PSE5_00580 [soil metagenome]